MINRYETYLVYNEEFFEIVQYHNLIFYIYSATTFISVVIIHDFSLFKNTPM